MTPRRTWTLILVLGIELARVSMAEAEQTPAPVATSSAAQSAGRALPWSKRLLGKDPAELLLVLDALGPNERDAANATRAIAELLAVGQPDVVTDHALVSLGRLGSREAHDVVAQYARHRRAEARRLAYLAWAHIHDPDAASGIAEGLRDSAPSVRAAAASALGELKARAATPLLLRALAKGVTEASPALGLAGDAASIEQFEAFLGRQPLRVMLAGYANYLARADLPDAAKLRCLVALENVSGGVVKEFLVDWLRKPPPSSPQLRQAVAAAILRIKVLPPSAPHTEPSR